MPSRHQAVAEPSPSRGPSAAFALSGIVFALLAGCGGGGSPQPKPPISLASEPALAGTPVRFQVTLPEGFAGPVSLQADTVELGTHTTDPADGFARAGGSCAEAGADFVAVTKGTLQVAASSRTGTIDVQTCPNTAVEANERFAIDVLWDGKPYRMEGLIVNNARGGLNDTGITRCLNAAGALTDCATTDLPGQDGATGRDARALTNAAADGRLGFSYTRDAATGCVTDQVTGLTWAPSAPATATWSDASALATAANAASQCGYTDWRVPTSQELLGLVDAGATSTPLIDTGFFGGTTAANHWAGDALSTDSSQAWYVSFAAGLSGFDNKLNPFAKAFHTRLVRGGTAAPAECDSDNAQRYVDHGNGTVTDIRTGLMWQRCADGLSGADCGTGTPTAHASFAAALGRATAVNADAAGAGRGHDDWRVPNRNELASLAQSACAAPAINRLRFPATPSIAPFWSSSPAATSMAWVVQFNDGSVLPASTTGNRHLRLVRAGQ